MSDREEHEPTHRLSRRTVLRLGLLAASVAPVLAGRAARARTSRART